MDVLYGTLFLTIQQYVRKNEEKWVYMYDLIHSAQQQKYSSSHTTLAHFSIGNIKNWYKKGYSYCS